jgi:hypothetical protein
MSSFAIVWNEVFRRKLHLRGFAAFRIRRHYDLKNLQAMDIGEVVVR